MLVAGGVTCPLRCAYKLKQVIGAIAAGLQQVEKRIDVAILRRLLHVQCYRPSCLYVYRQLHLLRSIVSS